MIALGIPIAISRSALLVTLAVLVVFWLGEASAVQCARSP